MPIRKWFRCMEHNNVSDINYKNKNIMFLYSTVPTLKAVFDGWNYPAVKIKLSIHETGWCYFEFHILLLYLTILKIFLEDIKKNPITTVPLNSLHIASSDFYKRKGANCFLRLWLDCYMIRKIRMETLFFETSVILINIGWKSDKKPNLFWQKNADKAADRVPTEIHHTRTKLEIRAFWQRYCSGH